MDEPHVCRSVDQVILRTTRYGWRRFKPSLGFVLGLSVCVCCQAHVARSLASTPPSPPTHMLLTTPHQKNFHINHHNRRRPSRAHPQIVRPFRTRSRVICWRSVLHPHHHHHQNHHHHHHPLLSTWRTLDEHDTRIEIKIYENTVRCPFESVIFRISLLFICVLFLLHFRPKHWNPFFFSRSIVRLIECQQSNEFVFTFRS